MNFTKALTIAAITLTSFAAQAQNIVICNPTGIINNAGNFKPFSGKKVVVDMGAHRLRTQEDNFVGNGRENINDRGEKWYGYTNTKTGENAVVVFGKSGMSLIVNIDDITLVTACTKA